MFRRDDWAMATLHALQHYDVVQPWSDAYDLGPTTSTWRITVRSAGNSFIASRWWRRVRPYWQGEAVRTPTRIPATPGP